MHGSPPWSRKPRDDLGEFLFPVASQRNSIVPTRGRGGFSNGGTLGIKVNDVGFSRILRTHGDQRGRLSIYLSVMIINYYRISFRCASDENLSSLIKCDTYI